MRDLIQRLFPALNALRFELTSPRDRRYNCVAWAAGDPARWWWPAEPPFSYWPAGVKREESITAFVEAFATLGYERADSGDPESNLEKVAIFATSDGVPTHMARQLPGGSWTSKLGGLEDIAHTDLEGVSGSVYGSVVAFLKRPMSSTA